MDMCVYLDSDKREVQRIFVILTMSIS